MILILLSLAIILTYVGVMVYRNGIPYSISDTFYSLEHKLWFGITMWLTSLLLMPGILDLTPEGYQFVSFLMCAGLMFVGAAPNFKKGIDRPVHITAATVSAVCSQVWVVLEQPYTLLMWAAWFIYIGIRIKQVWNGNMWDSFVRCKPLFWAESTAFAMVYSIVLSIHV